MDEQTKWFLETESTPDEVAVKIVGMTTRDLEYYRHLVDKAAAGFERTDSNSERSSTVGKRLSRGIARYTESFMRGRVNGGSKLHCCLILRNCPNPRQDPLSAKTF